MRWIRRRHFSENVGQDEKTLEKIEETEHSTAPQQDGAYKDAKEEKKAKHGSGNSGFFEDGQKTVVV